MAAEQKEATQTKTSSKQLLYAEKFGGTLLERKLQIVGNKKERLTKPCLPPPSSVLSRVKTLLPKLQAANEKLKNIPQKDVAIEISDTESDGPAIEMNLALMPSIENGDSNDNSSSEEEEESDEDEKGEEDSDEDSDKKDNESEDGPSISELLAPSNNQRNIRKRKLVEVLDEEDENDEEKGKEEDDSEAWSIALTVAAVALVTLLMLILWYLHKRMSQTHRAKKRRQEYVRTRARQASEILRLDDIQSVKSKTSEGSGESGKSRASVHFSESDTVFDPVAPVLRVYKMKRGSESRESSNKYSSSHAFMKPRQFSLHSVNVGSRRSVRDIAKEYQSPERNLAPHGMKERRISITVHLKTDPRKEDNFANTEHGHLMHRRHSWQVPTRSILKGTRKSVGTDDGDRKGVGKDFVVDNTGWGSASSAGSDVSENISKVPYDAGEITEDNDDDDDEESSWASSSS